MAEICWKGDKIIWSEFENALKNEKFIEEIYEDSLVVEESRAKHSVIINLNRAKNPSIQSVWRINLEAEISGISTKNFFKTPEIALLVLCYKEGHQTANLHVILVELKSTLKNSDMEKGKRVESTLMQCEEKFLAAMNRLYMLLSLKRKDAFVDNISALVRFKGLICFKEDRMTKDDNSQLYKILKNNEESLLTCKTIINQNDKISVLFDKGSEHISISDLIGK